MSCMEIVGPRLRKAYPEQPKEEWLILATEPIIVGDGKPYLLEIGNDKKNGLELSAIPAGPKRQFLPEDIFVFMK